MTDDDHKRVCLGKRHYLKWSEAEKAIKTMRLNASSDKGRRLRVYRCPVCNQGYCVGSGWKTKSKRKEFRNS